MTNINDYEITLSKQKRFITKIFDFYQMHLHVVQRAKLIRKGKYILYLQKGILKCNEGCFSLEWYGK